MLKVAENLNMIFKVDIIAETFITEYIQRNLRRFTAFLSSDSSCRQIPRIGIWLFQCLVYLKEFSLAKIYLTTNHNIHWFGKNKRHRMKSTDIRSDFIADKSVPTGHGTDKLPFFIVENHRDSIDLLFYDE